MLSPVVLLTGATGQVGTALVEWLRRERPAWRLYALVRDVTQAPAGVEAVAGDVALAEFGWTRALRQRLAAAVTVVVHCAANTRFTLALDEARTINLAGTRHVLDFAQQCAGLRHFVQVSTVYIAGRRQGLQPEVPIEHRCGWWNSYEQSKYEAEWAVLSSGLPWSVARISTVAGDSRTGVARRSHYLHQLLRLAGTHRLTRVPGAPDALVDLVAEDWVARSLGRLLTAEPGSVWQLCAGPQRSVALPEVLARVSAAWGRPSPELVAWQEFEHHVQALDQPGATRLAGLLQQFWPHLTLRQEFANERTLAALGAAAPDAAALLDRVIAHYVRRP